jgi:hypothetical protein
MPYDQMQTTLRLLGINSSNYKVLKVLPLVYQSWIAGKMSQERELRLVDLARLHFAIGADGEEILRGWLRQRPNIADFKEGLNDILVLAHAPYESGFEVDELPGLLAYAEALARTTAETMEAPILVTQGEAQALVDIANEFGVIDGQSWGALVRELRTAN